MSAIDLARLQAALRPLSAPPQGRGWNHASMRELLGDGPRRAAAVLVGLRGEQDPQLLLTRRTEHLSRHAGQVAFPGGRADDGDADIVATALRECEEEIGLGAEWVTPLGFLDRFETVSGFCVTPVVARIADRAPPPRIDAGEVAAVFEVPMSFLLDPGNRRHYVMHWQGHRRQMVEFHYQGHRIWGATAAMLTHFLDRLEALPT